MTRTQILKTMELIDEKFEALTVEKFDELACGDGCYIILEEAITEAFGQDTYSLNDFWQNAMSTYRKDKPNYNALAYQIIDKYYQAVFGRWFDKNIK